MERLSCVRIALANGEVAAMVGQTDEEFIADAEHFEQMAEASQSEEDKANWLTLAWLEGANVRRSRMSPTHRSKRSLIRCTALYEIERL